MPPKKATSATAKKPAHPPYLDLVKEAVVGLKEKGGSSRQAIKKFVLANYKTIKDDATFNTQINKAIKKGSENGTFNRPKGDSGPVKLGLPKSGESKPAVAKKAPATKPKPATKTKKAPVKKTTVTKKAPAKKAATKTKANTSKVRKTPTAAPAVVEKPPVVLGKTKSGRVTKTKAPGTLPEKKAAPKKRKAPAKKATPKK